MEHINLTGKFLVAMPWISTPFFARALIYICEHNEEGALGVIVNRPTELTLGELYEKIDLNLSRPDFSTLPVYFGGPVQTDRGFVLHRPLGCWKATLGVNDEIGLTSSRDVLESLSRRGKEEQGSEGVECGDAKADHEAEAQNAQTAQDETEIQNKPDAASLNKAGDMLVMLGYAGWGANQIEEEIKENAWLSLEGDAEILFDTPTEDRLTEAMARLGVDYSRLSGDAGHA